MKLPQVYLTGIIAAIIGETWMPHLLNPFWFAASERVSYADEPIAAHLCLQPYSFEFLTAIPD